MKDPEPVYLQHLSAKAAKRVDYWLGQMPGGSVTVHRSKEDQRVKIQVQIFEVVDDDEGPLPGE